MGYEAKSTTSKSRQRRRTELAALTLLDEHIRLPPSERNSALARIRVARQPVAEAKRIIAQATKRAVKAPSDGIDFSVVQELRAKLIRRDGGIWEPQASMLRGMDADIASGDITRESLEGWAALVWGMHQALPKQLTEAAQAARPLMGCYENAEYG